MKSDQAETYVAEAKQRAIDLGCQCSNCKAVEEAEQFERVQRLIANWFRDEVAQ